MQFYNTACPRNCYSTCSFKVGVEDGRIVRIDPQPLNRATPEGPCLKGLSYLDRVYAPDRLLYPRRKVNGSFERISWDEAFMEIADRLKYYKSAFGAQSILYYFASGTSGLLNGVGVHFWRMFGGATTVYGNLCWPAGLEATRLTLGEIKHNVPWDLENTRLILLWGKNPAETNIQEMIPIEKAQARGAKLVVIDPRRTVSAERADLLVQPRPGTDGLLALTIAGLLIENEMIDRDFIDHHVSGFEAFEKQAVAIDLNHAADTCGVSLKFIRKLAELIGTVKPMTLLPGYGMQRYSNGGQTIRCLLSLPVITGNIGKPGSGWHYADLQGDIFSDLKEPLSYYPEEKPDPLFRRSISTTRLGAAMLEQDDPPLRMAWVERGNPLSQNPRSGLVRQAFRKLDFRVVVEQFMTDTAREADIVLPAKSMFEQSDIISSYWNPYVQMRQKVIDPPGAVKPETEIYYWLAQRLKFSESGIAENIPFPSDAAIEKWLERHLEKFPEISLEKLKFQPVLAPGLQKIAFSDLKFNTPSGKIELYSERAKTQWGVDPLPQYVPLKEGWRNGAVQYPFHLLSPNTKNRIHSQFGNLQSIRALDPEPYATVNSGDAQSKNIRDGDHIRVFNDRGSLHIRVRTDASLRPGSVVIFNGYWHQEGACPNALSEGRETDMGYGAAFHDNLIDFEKVDD